MGMSRFNATRDIWEAGPINWMTEQFDFLAAEGQLELKKDVQKHPSLFPIEIVLLCMLCN